MFNIGAGELIIILLIAFVVVGPKDLPKIGRALGRGIRQMKGFMGELQETVNTKETKTYIDDLTKDISGVQKDLESYNPVNMVKKELNSLDPLSDAKKNVAEIKKEVDNIEIKLGR